MTHVWTLMIDNRTQSFCQFVLPWNFSLSTETETTEKVFLVGLPCLGLTISLQLPTIEDFASLQTPSDKVHGPSSSTAPL